MNTQPSPEQTSPPAGRHFSNTTATRTLGKEASPSPSARSRPEATQHKPLPAFTQVVPAIAEILIAAAGSLILWWGAEGRGVTHGNQLSTTIFIAALTTLMTGRGFILAMLKSTSMGLESLPTATRWLAVARNILLVAAAIYSKYLNDYMTLWVIAFAAITLAATGIAGLVFAIIRKDLPRDITSRFLDACAGVLAVVFTQSLHGWDPQFICTLVSLILVPSFFAWTLTKTIRQD